MLLYVTYTSPRGKILAVYEENASHSCYVFVLILYILSSPLILSLLIMRCLYSHIKKASPYTEMYFSLSSLLFLSLTYTQIHALVSTHTYTAHRQSAVPFPQQVARKENTLPVPALHTYTHTYAHTNSATALYTLLKGHDTDLYIATKCQHHTWVLNNNMYRDCILLC